MLVIDERSMISADILRQLDALVKQSALNALSSEGDFGGIFVVVVVDDDFQLSLLVYHLCIA